MLRIAQEGLTFDDVLLVPAHSKVLPNQADLRTKLTNKISLKIPLLAAAMDSVSEEKFAIALALEGGMAFIHKNMPVAEQAKQVLAVKQHLAHNPDLNLDNASLDDKGALLVGAAVGAAEANRERIKALVEAGVDVILIDSSHGHSQGVIDRVKQTRRDYPDLEIVAGNVATGEGALALALAGASAIKVGIGPGSICTTRIVTGCGVPQLTAVANAVNALRGFNVPVIADGGIRFSGDISKAIAAGATTVMLGSLFAGALETPGDVFVENGKTYKQYRGMGSISAMQSGSSDRYFQSDNAKDKLVPEGVEAKLEVKGSLSFIVAQLIGGLRSAMGLTGSKTIEDLRTKAEFVRISGAGIKESHVHNVIMTNESPNYKGIKNND